MELASRHTHNGFARIYAFITALILALPVFSQEVTVMVNPVQQVLPPQAGLYLTNPGRYFTIQLFNNTDEPQYVHLGMQIQQHFPNEELWLSTNMETGHIPRQPITIAPNQHKTLNAIEMAHLFDHFTNGDVYIRDGRHVNVTDGDYGRLPEGQYEVFVTAYKWNPDLASPVVVSAPNEGNATFSICYEANPPQFTYPVMTALDGGFDNLQVVRVNKNDPSFEWNPPSLNCNATMVNFKHAIRFVELNGMTPDEAMFPNTPTFHEKKQIVGNRYTIPPAYVAQMIEPGQAKGKVYAVQLTATTDYFNSQPGSVNFTLINNDGKSPIMLVQLYDPMVPEEPSDSTGSGGSTIDIDSIHSKYDDIDQLYAFSQPALILPSFEGKMSRTASLSEYMTVKWHPAWFEGGKGQHPENVKFKYKVRLYKANTSDKPETIFTYQPIHTIDNLDTLACSFNWYEINHDFKDGDYLMLRVTAEPTNEESVLMLPDSLNYIDFALTTGYEETFACGTSTANVANKTLISQKPGRDAKLTIGSWDLTLDNDYEKLKYDDSDHSLSGYGWISWSPGQYRARIAVKFDKLKVNTDNVVFDGTCKTYAQSTHQIEGTEYTTDQFLDSLFSDTALNDIFGTMKLPDDVQAKISNFMQGDENGESYNLAKGYNLGKYYTMYKKGEAAWNNWTAGNICDMYFPAEAPDEIKQFLPSDFSLQIANITFSPSAAIMNVIGEIALPNSDIFDGQDVLIFGAPRLCIQPDKLFPEDGVLALLSNFAVKDPSSDFKLIFKAPKTPEDPRSHDGCFIRWENDEFDALGMEIAVDIPNTKRVIDGKVQDDIPAMLDLWTVIEAGDAACDFLAEGTLTAFQVTDLPGWTFGPKKEQNEMRVVFDHNLSRNSDGMPTVDQITKKFPANTFDPDLCGTYVQGDWNAWQGLYISSLAVEFPKFAVFGGEGEQGLSIGVNDMIVDASGVTCQVFADDIIETGECGGWEFSIKTAKVDIIQNNFDNCVINGGFGVPLFGKKADEKAAAESGKKGGVSGGGKDGKDDYEDFIYTCQIRHLTKAKDVTYQTWSSDGKTKVTKTRKAYDDNRLSYLFKTEQKNDLSLNCFVASLDLKKDQSYFLVESIDKENGTGQDTQVELCLAGDITIAGTDNANERIAALAKKLGQEKLDLKLPGIHFVKMRLSNKQLSDWKDLGIDPDDTHKTKQEKMAQQVSEWKKSKLYVQLAEGEELRLGDNCYFHYGEWSLASERKKIGPFSYNLDKFEPNFDESTGKVTLDISGDLGLVEDKICVGAGLTISSVLHKEGKITNWYLSDGDVDFKSLKLDLDFTALHLKGELTIGDNGKGDNGYAGSLDIDITGLFSVNCKGGYFKHTTTEADKAKMLETAGEEAKAAVERAKKSGKGSTDYNYYYSKYSTIEPDYSWGYFLASLASEAGIPMGPLSINRISGGFYVNCKPTPEKGATKDSPTKLSGDPVAQYGSIGVAFGIGLQAASGGESIKGDVDLLVVYDRKNSCLSTFMFNGKVEAVGGIISSEVSLVYENSKDHGGETVDRYLCLNITTESGWKGSPLGEKLQKANEVLSEMKDELDAFQDQVNDVVDTAAKGQVMESLDKLSGDYNKGDSSKKNQPKDADDIKGKNKDDLGTSGSVTMPLELKITWVDNYEQYNPSRWHLYLGEPTPDKRCKIIFLNFDSSICSAHIGADSYLCLGNELPGNGQLPAIPEKITEFLTGHKNSSTDMGADLASAQNARTNVAKTLNNSNSVKGGVMVGASAWGDIRVDLGLLYGSMDAIAGFDAALVNYGNTAYCVNTHSEMGYKGWYATGQLYAYLFAELGLRIHIGSLINKDVKILTGGIGGILELGLPNPTWIDGKARVKISLFGGLWNINRSFHFAAGDHCVPFKGNALDGFELFAGVNMGSDSLYQALYQPEFAISKNEVGKMTFTTNTSLGSHYRLVDPTYADKMKEEFYSGYVGDAEHADSIANLLKAQASRTYVFDTNKSLNTQGMKMGVRLIDLGTKPTEWLEQGRELSPKEFVDELKKQGITASGEQAYAGANHPKDKSQAESALHTYNDVLQFFGVYFNKREETVSEMSTVMNGYELSKTEKYILHSGKMTSYIGHLLDNGTFKDGTAISQHERNVSFRENKGQTFHLTNMEVQEGHSYALLLLGDAYEINNGERVWCDYVDTLTNLPVPIKWQQAKIWFFRVKGTAEDVVIADSLRDLEPYVALAYPSVDGTKVKNRSENPSLAYFGDIMEPTIALNRDLTNELPKGKMKWILTAYDAREYERNDTTCWKEEQIIDADYTVADNCINLKPAKAFTRITRFSNEIASKGRSYDYGNELYHLQLAYYYRPEKAERDTANYIVDLWLHTAPHGVTVDGMSGTQDDNWMQSTNRELTGELLTYVAPFVGASPSVDPVFDYEFKDANGNFLTDEDIVFKNAKYKNGTPYRLIDPWMYFAYLSKWTFIGDRKLNGYDFDSMYTPFASESLVYDYNGTVVNSDFIKGATAKSLIFLRDDMYKTWNNWNFYGTQEGFPQWPLPSTMKVNGMITAANQTGTASTVKPRILGVSQDDNTYNFSEIAEDFMAPYRVASRISIKLRDEAQELWDNFGMLFVIGDPVQNVGNVGDNYFNMLQKSWSNLHRGQYVEISERGVTVRVPYYQLPLIFGGCFGDTDDNDTYYNGRHLNLLKRGFRSSVSKDLPSETRWNTDVSNILFFRLIGDQPSPWSQDWLPQVFQKSTNSQYSDSYSGDRQVAIDQFDSYGALKEVTQFTAQTYRVDAYDISTGLYHMKRRAAQPWLNTFKIGADSDIKTMADMSNAIINAEQDMMTTSDYATPWAVYTPGNKTLTLLFSKENYSLKSEYNKEQIALNGRFKGDQVLSHDWTGDTDIRTQMERLVIDKSFKEVELKDLSYWFTRCEKLKTITGLENLNTASVTNMDAMFSACESLESLDLSSLDTRNVKRMNYLFANCKNLKTVNLSSLNTSSLTSMVQMFNGCEKLSTVNFQHFNTQAVTSIGALFKDCSSLTTLDLSSFTGENIVSCAQMFYGCSKLKTLDISAFNADELITNVDNCKEMFVSVPNNLVSYIDFNLKEEIKDQIPGKKNVDNGAMKAVLAKNGEGKHVLIFLNSKDSNLKVGAKSIKTQYEDYQGLTVEKIYEGDNVMSTGSTVPGWAGDKSLVKVVFDKSFKTSPTSMFGWFRGCENLTTIECEGKLRTDHVKNMAFLFSGCSNLQNADFVRSFNTDEVEDMSAMFSGCKKLETLSLYDVAAGLDGSYKAFNTENVKNMNYMFQDCESLTRITLGEYFDLGSVVYMEAMFKGCKRLQYIEREKNLRELAKAENAKIFESMFDGCESIRNVDLMMNLLGSSSLKFGNLRYMFRNCKSLTELDLSRFSVSKFDSSPSYMSSMFEGCTALRKLYLNGFVVSNLTSCDDMFKGVPNDCYIYLPYNTSSKIHTGQVSKQAYPNLVLIYPAKVLLVESGSDKELFFLNTDKTYNVGGTYDGKKIVNVWTETEVYEGSEGAWYTSAPWQPGKNAATKDVVKVTFTPEFKGVMPVSMREWFYNMTKLTEIVGMENLNTSQVKDMQSAFRNCESLKTIDLSHFETANVENMNMMFYNCKALTKLDLSRFDTHNVTNMEHMFSDCTYLKNIDVSSFNTAKVTRMVGMFDNCKALVRVDVSGFDTQNAAVSAMFYGCSSLAEVDMSNFDTSKNPDLYQLFSGCSSLRTLTVGKGFHGVRIKEEENKTFDGVHDLDVYVKADEFDRIRAELLEVGFVEGVTGHIYGQDVQVAPQVIWTEGNSTLTFTNSPIVNVGDDFEGQSVTAVWSGTDITDTPVSSGIYAPWAQTVRSKVKKVNIKASFHQVTPKSTACWFSGNQVLTEIDGLNNLNTSEVENMKYMFNSCKNLTKLDLSAFNTEKVTNMNGMFASCSALKSLNVSGFNTSNVTDMGAMFSHCGLEALDISDFNTNNVTNANQLFYYSTNDTKKVKALKVGPEFKFSKMTTKATNAFQNVKDMQVTYVLKPGTNRMWAYDVKDAMANKLGFVEGTHGRFVFSWSKVAQVIWTDGNKTLTFICDDKQYKKGDTFNGQTVTTVWSGEDVTNTTTHGWSKSSMTSNGQFVATGGSAYKKLEKLVIDPSFADVNAKNMRYWFCFGGKLFSMTGLEFLNTEDVTSMESMFETCKVSSLDVSNFNTQNVTSMENMFSGCSNLTSLDVSNFSTQHVTTMHSMFNGCSKLETLTLGDWDVSQVTSMTQMFMNCKSLKQFTFSTITSSQLSVINGMFSGCTSLTSLDMRSFNIYARNISSVKSMFNGCSSLKTLKLGNGFLFNTASNFTSSNNFNQVSGLKIIVECSGEYFFNNIQSNLTKMGFTNTNGTITFQKK